MEVNYTLNLIKQRVDIKKFAIGTAVLIAIAIIVGLILHFTGVIDLNTMFLQQAS